MQDQSTLSSGYFWMSTDNITLSHFPQIFACGQQTVILYPITIELWKELLHSLMQIFSALIVLHIFYGYLYFTWFDIFVAKPLSSTSFSAICMDGAFLQLMDLSILYNFPLPATFCVLQIVKDPRSLAIANKNYAS